jgi:hypothetical protein
MIEIKVRVSNEEKSMTMKHLIYDQDEPVSLGRDDPTLRLIVEEAVKEFGSSPEDVLLTCKMTW